MVVVMTHPTIVCVGSVMNLHENVLVSQKTLGRELFELFAC